MITLAGYTNIKKIYESQNTLVCRGLRALDNLPIVIKILKKDFPSPRETARFRQEYRLASQMKCDGVVKALNFEDVGQHLAIIYEDFGGIQLTELLSEPQLSQGEFLDLALKCVHALAGLQSHNITHKDINPANILLNRDSGQVKIIDLGISTDFSSEKNFVEDINSLEGTLAYISPEQTGRMNRASDYRSDFYSLGVTLYELLCHLLPFSSCDPLEIIHCHLAREPLAPHKLRHDVSPIISAIIMKLMAKNAEDRYQSCLGIEEDLLRCRQQLETKKNISAFPLGEKDACDSFVVSQKLYGRDKELCVLGDAWRRASEGGCELVLVTGDAGCGKTALVYESVKQINLVRGYFARGKFDEFKKDIPYFGIVSALSTLVQQILNEDKEKLEQWRGKISEAVEPNGSILLAMIPEVEGLLYSQPPAAKLDFLNAENRFNLVIRRFLRVLCTANHPLFLFLDDLQWADSASLRLLENILSDTSLRYLFVVGTCRDDAVSHKDNILKLTLERLHNENIAYSRLNLSLLTKNDVCSLLADTLAADNEVVRPLAYVVYAKTMGNPFYVRLFVQGIYEAGIFKFSSHDMSWRWGLSQIEVIAMTDNVADLLAGKINKFNTETTGLLHIAACIGHSFDIGLVSKIANRTRYESLSLLAEAIQEGILVSLPGSYILGMTDDELQAENGITLSFAHDRIQHQFYAAIADSEKAEIHRKVGTFLFRHISEECKKEQLFTIVNHLNFSLNIVDDQVDTDELIRLNLLAGRRAKAAAAWEPAMNYLQVGLGLLGEQGWHDSYDMALTLYSEAAETAYLCGRFVEMDQFITSVLDNGKDLLEKVFVYEVKIQACKAQYKIEEAVDISLVLLKMLDVSFPENPNAFHAMLHLQRIRFSMLGKDIEDLLDNPVMEEPFSLAAMRVMNKMGSAVYFVKPTLLPLLVFAAVNMSIKRGNAPESAFLYAVFGMIHCGVLGDIPKGLRYGRLALQVLAKFGSKEIQAKTLHMVHAFIDHWQRPLHDTIDPLRKGFQSGVESGDFEYAGYCAVFYGYHLFLSGKNLEQIEVETATYGHAIGTLKQETSLYLDAIVRQTIALIRNSDDGKSMKLSGDIYNETVLRPLHEKANDRTTLFFMFCSKLILNYLFGHHEKAVENAAQCELYLDGVISQAGVPVFYFYDSLAHLGTYADSSPLQKNQILSKVVANQKKLKKWSTYAPMNYLHKYYLVNAELCRVKGKFVDAAEGYDLAVEGAKENKFLNEEGLAYELAAQFCLSQHRHIVARAYMQSAKHCYLRWGADGKVKQLDEKHADLLIGYSSATGQDMDQTKTVTRRTISMIGSGSGLDLVSVMKASQAISGEIVLDNLLRKMIAIVIENVGAQIGFLLLQKHGKLVVAVRGEMDKGEARTVLQMVDLEGELGLSHTIVNNVARTREFLIVNNPVEGGEFAHDPYVQQQKPKSVLCVPLIHKEDLTGILYLENNIFSHMFTLERLEVVKILCSQIAISLENAGLFSFLEESEQRYRQLYENIIDMVILVDQDKKILLANPLFYYLFSIQESERDDLMFLDWVHPDDVRRVNDTLLAADGVSDVVRDFPFRMINDGNEIDVECNTKWIRRDDSVQFQMVIRDVTERKRLEQELIDSLQDVQEARVGTILGLAKLAEYRDADTGSHLERIREYARVIAMEMAKLGTYAGYITPKYIDDLYLSSILHDIGKVGIPDAILLKEGKLSPEEFDIMKRHTTYGGEALRSVEKQTQGQSFLALGKAIAFHHHEKWDGSGYPEGLKEEQIPLSTRIVALVDVYDALTSKRSYKEAFSHEVARGIIVSSRAKHFAPDVVDAFLQSEDQFAVIRGGVSAGSAEVH